MTDFTAATITILQPLIKKPTLKANLLQKPPFRFLHDIVTNLQTSSVTPGFPPIQLFEADQLNSENVKEKEQKLAFLNRVFSIISAVTGATVDCNAAKVIAGQEPEKTNIMLQELAKAAMKKMDKDEIVARVTGNKAPEQPTQKKPTVATPPSPAPTRPSATSLSSSSSLVPSRSVISLPPPPATPEDYSSTTQRLLGSLITKPTLKPNLLQKPPFRFLHDIVTSLINSPAQYPAAYFTADETDSSKFDNTDKKIAFLKKLVDIVQATTGTDLSTVQPKKIVAGLEPEQTNLLLQHLARAAASGITAQDAAKKLNAGTQSATTTPSTAVTAARTVTPPAAEKKAAPVASAAAVPVKAIPVSAASSTPPADASSAGSPTVPKLSLTQVDKDGEKTEISNNSNAAGVVLTNIPGIGDDGLKKLERPMTARQGPPKLKSNNIIENNNQADSKDNNNSNKEEKFAENPSAPSTTNVPSSASSTTKPSNQDTKKKKGVILESEAVEEEPEEEIAEDPSSNDLSLSGKPGFQEEKVNAAEQGGLMRKILEATEEKTQPGTNANDSKTKPASSKDAANAAASVSADEKTEELRRILQRVCHSVNPLGKCMEFLVDDLDEISRESVSWRNRREEYMQQLEEEQKNTTHILEPLQQQLEEMTRKVQEQEKRVEQMKAILWKKEQTIKSLLESKMSTQN